MTLRRYIVAMSLGLFLSSIVLQATVFADGKSASVPQVSSSETQDAQPTTSAEDSGAADASDTNQPLYLLRYQFRTGDKLRYKSIQKLTQQGIAKAGQDIDNSQIQQQRLFTVKEINDGGEAQVAMQFEHVRMEMQSGNHAPVIFDSTMTEDEVPPRFRQAAHSLKKAAPVYTVSTAGSPVDDEGVEVFPEGGQATFMIPLPTEAIPVGHSWKTNIVVTVRLDLKVNREIKLLRTYRLESVEDDIATIRFATSIATVVKSPAVKAQLLQATPQGEIQFHVTQGRLIRKEIRIDNLALGVLGPNSMLSAVGSTVETLVADDAAAVTSR